MQHRLERDGCSGRVFALSTERVITEFTDESLSLNLECFVVCAEMQAGAGEMLQPVAVQMFRVLVNTEGAAQAGSITA